MDTQRKLLANTSQIRTSAILLLVGFSMYLTPVALYRSVIGNKSTAEYALLDSELCCDSEKNN